MTILAVNGLDLKHHTHDNDQDLWEISTKPGHVIGSISFNLRYKTKQEQKG